MRVSQRGSSGILRANIHETAVMSRRGAGGGLYLPLAGLAGPPVFFQKLQLLAPPSPRLASAKISTNHGPFSPHTRPQHLDIGTRASCRP